MAHLSETNSRLVLENCEASLSQKRDDNAVWLIKMPFWNNNQSIPSISKIITNLNTFIEKQSSNSTIVILSSPLFIANFLSKMTPRGFVKLCIGVKLKEAIHINDGYLPQHHASLAIITTYKEALQHTKTRIAYTFCPYCQKTTKDYGGKKHLYHEYGTIMSDVWRDIEIDYNLDTSLILDRLQDLFAIPQYKSLKYIDLSKELNNEQTIIFKQHDDGVSEFSYNGSAESIIVNDDCLKVLKEIPSSSVDFCFADPPYNVNKKYESWDDAIDIKEYFEWCDKWLVELARIIKPGRTVAVLNIPQWAIRHFKCLNEILDFQDWIIWESLSVPVRMVMPAHYSVICFTKGKPNSLPIYNSNHSTLETHSLTTQKEFYCIRNSCLKNRQRENINDKMSITNIWWDIHRLKHNSQRVDHPTQLPPLFMKRLISIFTNEGDIVLDPFNGSGTTSLCSKQLNRKYLGIELSQKYYDISIQRHIELNEGVDPFGKREKTPKAKNSSVKRLKKQKYEVDKKTLQLEVKEISKKLNKVPSREDIIANSQYPIKYFDEYFINWGEVVAAARTTGMQNVENKKDYDALVGNGHK